MRSGSLVFGLAGLVVVPLLGAGPRHAARVNAPQDAAAPEGVALEALLGVPSASQLVAAPAGRAVAWVQNDRGQRNVWVADDIAPGARRLTAFGRDDGQQLSELSWSPDGRAVVFTRGNGAGAAGEPLNPSSDLASTPRSVWMAAVDGSGAPQLGEGHSPAVSPHGDQVAFLKGRQIWVVPATDRAPARQLLAPHGAVSSLAWSPDGEALAFTLARGGHTLVAVFGAGRRMLEYVSPSADRDLYPRWSPDGRRLAFIRLFNIEATMRSTERFGAIDSPWAVMVATRGEDDAGFGPAFEVWRAPDRPLGSFPRTLQFLDWVDGDRLVFASEHEGWAHLYLADPSAPATPPSLLTPGSCEVDDVAVAAGRRTLVVASNCGDLERRHLWSIDVSADGATERAEPRQLTSGTSVDTAPVVTADGKTVVFLRGEGRTPTALQALSLADLVVKPFVPDLVSPAFPSGALVEPRVVTFKSDDGLDLHAVVYASPAAAGRADRRPALVHVHGGPTSGQELAGWQPVFQYLVSRGFLVLGLNYRGGAGYGRAFREIPEQGANGAAEYQDVEAAARYLRARPDVDPARIGIWGMSYGGYLTQLALARNSDLFAAGVTECGIFDLAAGQSPNNPARRSGDAARLALASSAGGSIDRWRSPVLIIHGDDDPGVDFNLQTVALVRALRARGVRFELLVLPDEGHGSSVWAHVVRGHQATADFFARTLGLRAKRP